MTIQVFGHKSPDTDSTGAPIVWAWYLSEIKGTPAAPKLLGEPNTEAAFVLAHWGLDKPEIISGVAADAPVVIVDTNNPAELPEGINDADIQAIIDHHKLVGGLETKGPIDIRIEPLACTATIMYKMIGDDLAQAPKAIKGAMLSCIISDTLEFRSPPPRRKTAPSPKRWPRISVSRSATWRKRCSPRNPTSRRFPTPSCCGWIPRNMASATPNSASRCWKPPRPRLSSTARTA